MLGEGDAHEGGTRGPTNPRGGRLSTLVLLVAFACIGNSHDGWCCVQGAEGTKVLWVG